MPRKDIVLIPEGLNVSIKFKTGTAITICEIRNRSRNNIVSYGISHCRFIDEYNKVTGLKLALKSAIRKLHEQSASSDGEQLVRSATKTMWDCFFQRFPLKE